MPAEVIADVGTGLVERGPQLEQLAALLAGLERGEGGVASIEAGAGLGKTALVRAGVRGARARGLPVRSACASELDRDRAFGVVRQLLEPLVLAGSAADRARLFEGAADLARPVFGLAARAAPDGRPAHAGGHEVLHGLFWLIGRLAARAPLVVAVDDVHWADAPSLRFLAFLVQRSDSVAVLLLLAGRPAADGESALLEEALRAVGAVRIRPGGLSQEGVARIVTSRLGQRPVAAFSDACAEVTAGNPFYLQELLAELGDRRVEPVAANLATVHALAPPAVGRAVLRAASRLPEGARAMLEAVAILGDDVDPGRAGRLAGLSFGVAADAVHALVEAQLLRPGARLAFTHPIVRATVYDGLHPADRAERHAAAVTLLRAEGERLDRVALQLLRTTPGAVDATAQALERAATEAGRRGAPEIAARYLRRALEEPLTRARQATLALALGNAAAAAGDPDAEELLRAALEQAEGADARADAAIALARMVLLAGRAGVAAALLAALADELAPEAPAGARRLELELLATADVDLSVRTELGDRLERAVLRVAADAPATEPLVLAHGAVDLLRRGTDAGRAADMAEAALAGLGSASVSGARALVEPLLIYVLVCAERYEAARGACDQLLALARAEGSAQGFVVSCANRSLVDFRTGALVDSEAGGRQALDVATLNRWPPLQLLAFTGLVEPMLERTGPEAAALAVGMASTTVDLDALATAQAVSALFVRGRVRVAAGAVEPGCADLLRCGKSFSSWGMVNPAVSPWRSHAAVALAGIGERAQGLTLADDELALARRWGSPRPLGLALRARGLVAGGAEGLAALGDAVDVLEPSAARLEHARALIDLGGGLRRAGRRRASRQALRRGVELAQECGAEPLARRGRVELRVAGGRARSPMATGCDALTPSEARIAEMAAQGRSNLEIAQALFLTSKTIEMHLTSAYRKLGISSRRQLPEALRDAPGERDAGSGRPAVQGASR